MNEKKRLSPFFYMQYDLSMSTIIRLTATFWMWLSVFGAGLWAQDTLTVEQCRELAATASPLQAQKQHAATIASLQTASLRSAQLPRINVGGQATLQSAAFGLPIESPLFQVPAVPKDQYRLQVDISQRLWDGQSDRVRRAQYALEQEAASAQADVDVFSLREAVTDLFFKILLLQESAAILENSLLDLKNKQQQVHAAVLEGVLLRTQEDQLQIQILKMSQQLSAIKEDDQTLRGLLALWIGRPEARLVLQIPTETSNAEPVARPEWSLFNVKQQQLEIAKEGIALRRQPRLDAFAQGGWGNPNPLNFFDQGLFGLVGIRAQWTPFDWGADRKAIEVLAVQQQQIGVQKQAFELRMQAQSIKDRQEMEKNQAMLALDQQVIDLQKSILQRADEQVKSGVMTMTDYLTQVQLLTQAQLTYKTHQLQVLYARESEQAHGK
jgi:outer membrane protein TolC